MKIVYIASNPDWGGATVALYNIIKYIYKIHEVCVILPNTNGRLYDELQSLGVQTYVIDYRSNIYYKSRNILKGLFRTFNMLRINHVAKAKLACLIKSLKPDIVHCNVGPIDISLDVCLKYKIPHVWHIREYQDLDFNMTFFPSRKYFLKRIHNEGNHNIAITKGVFEYWDMREGIDLVIYDPVIDNPLKVSFPSNKDKYFLFVGRVEEAKGLFDVIVAFAEFCKERRDFTLKIAGNYSKSSRYFNECMKLINKNDLSDRVEFLGHRTDVYSLMQKATAQIVASRFEGFGFITAEAMFNNCLVIGRNTAGTKEQFDNGVHATGKEIGYRFNDTSELVQDMKIAVSNDQTSILEDAYRTVSTNYTSAIFGKKLLEFYENINLHTEKIQ